MIYSLLPHGTRTYGIPVCVALPSAPDTNHPIQDQIGDDLVAETIHYKKKIGDTQHYLVKWRDVEELSYVRDTIAHQKFPQVVIAFLERHLVWDTVY
ncbi:unnamed protein product [Macrosiphum euphorbiae]|uniref:Chromo shadow domain-containing protein n=1 Tax=Macrosiphum euphorbiae TaxID=13131 RepID=A0AAV0XWE5_9HEMI|nr:unnamed protein product [Macrosiphum euphorbiae]